MPCTHRLPQARAGAVIAAAEAGSAYLSLSLSLARQRSVLLPASSSRPSRPLPFVSTLVSWIVAVRAERGRESFGLSQGKRSGVCVLRQFCDVNATATRARLLRSKSNALHCQANQCTRVSDKNVSEVRASPMCADRTGITPRQARKPCPARPLWIARFATAARAE